MRRSQDTRFALLLASALPCVAAAPEVVSVPTLSFWGKALLVVALIAASGYLLGRRPRRPPGA